MKIVVVDSYNAPYICWDASLVNAYLNSFFKKHNYDADFIDCDKLILLDPFKDRIAEKEEKYLEKCCEAAMKSSPQIVLFNYKTFALPFIFEVSKKIKQQTPDIVTILGGANSELVNSIKNYKSDIDYFLLGDLELTLEKFLKDFEKGDLSHRIYNCGEIQDLNPLTPDFSLYRDNNLLFLPYDISRGCKFNCKFCAKIGNSFRVKSIKKVISDLKSLAEKHKVGFFRFVDEYFNHDLIFLNKLCLEIKKSGLNIKFMCDWVLDRQIDIKLIRDLKNVGLNYLVLSIESFSGREFTDLNFYNKEFLFNYLSKIIPLIKKLDVNIILNILTNSYDDNEESFEQIKVFIDNIKKYAEIHIEQVLIFPGSRLWGAYKNGDLAVLPRDSVDFPPQKEHLFSCKYKNDILLSPQRWMVKNKDLYGEIRQFLKKEEHIYMKNKEFAADKYTYELASKGLMANVNFKEHISQITVRAAAKKAPIYKDFYLSTPQKVNILLDGKIITEFNLDKGLEFSNYYIKLSKVINPGKHEVEFITANDNLFIDRVEFEGVAW